VVLLKSDAHSGLFAREHKCSSLKKGLLHEKTPSCCQLYGIWGLKQPPLWVGKQALERLVYSMLLRDILNYRMTYECNLNTTVFLVRAILDRDQADG
jgi:hypothetical protein